MYSIPCIPMKCTKEKKRGYLKRKIDLKKLRKSLENEELEKSDALLGSNEYSIGEWEWKANK